VPYLYPRHGAARTPLEYSNPYLDFFNSNSCGLSPAGSIDANSIACVELKGGGGLNASIKFYFVGGDAWKVSIVQQVAKYKSEIEAIPNRHLAVN